jgi:glycosyltransferase involved in cell wall biosynthesis
MRDITILSSVHIALDNRVFYREARSLARAGYKVTLIAIHDRTETKDGVKIIGLPTVPRWQRPRLWWTLLQLARQTGADVFHFHDPELLLVTPWLRWLTGKPTIYDVHEVYADFIKVKDYMPAWLRYPIAWSFNWLEPLLARLQSALIFSDDEIAVTFKNVHRPKLTLFNYPGRFFVDQGLAATRSNRPRPPVVLHLGGHERNRGTWLMIEAFHRVRQKMPEARLVLVGHFVPANLEQEVRAHVSRLGLESAVTIAGRVPFETVGNYLAQAAVGWLPWQPVPKNDKNIPTKLFEYMAYAVPIVSSELRSTRPFVQNGENGLLVTADDPAAHAEAILTLLSQPDDAAEMGRRGQQLVDTRYNWDEMEKQLIGFYQALMS